MAEPTTTPIPAEAAAAGRGRNLRPVPPRHPLLAALEPVAEALGATLVPASRLVAGDIPLRWDDQLVGGLRLPGVRGALDRMIAAVESELGAPLASLSRVGKQRAVRLLDDRGAFQLRRSVEEVADALGVSRFTVYNYLNAEGR
jgi:HTH domain